VVPQYLEINKASFGICLFHSRFLILRREEGESALWFVEKEAWSAVPRAGYDEKRQAPSKYEMHVIWRTWSMINGFCFPANYSMSLDICAQFTVDTTLFLLPSFSPLPVLVLFRTFSSAGWAARPDSGAIFRLNFNTACSPLSLNEQVFLGMPRQRQSRKQAFPGLKR
jgi:hypothetical protein